MIFCSLTEFKPQKRFSHQEQPHLKEYVGLDTAQEDRDVGAVSLRTYWTFFRVGASILSLLLALSLFVLVEGNYACFGFNVSFKGRVIVLTVLLTTIPRSNMTQTNRLTNSILI